MSGWRNKGGKDRTPKPSRTNTPKAAASAGGWRQKTASSDSGSQNWRRHRQRTAGLSRGFKLGGLLLLFFLTVGTLTWWLLNMPVSVPFVALNSEPYEFPAPPLPFASENVDWFSDQLGRSHPNVDFVASQKPIRAATDLLEEMRYRLEQVSRPGGPGKNVMMVYLRAHGVVNSNGQPCLLLPASRLLDESTWLPMQDVFETLKGRDPKSEIQKLVLLDCGHNRRLWQAGVLHNTFAAKLEALVTAESAAKISVIHASDHDQLSQAAPEFQGTAFANFLARGIRGEADSRQDDVITLHELHQYLSDKVNSFAHNRRADLQVPVLLPRDVVDFPVAHASGGDAVESLPPVEVPSYDVKSLWERFAQLRARNAYEWDPLAWAELEARLVRTEQVLLAGRAYAPQLDQREIVQLMDDLERRITIDVDAAPSLAIAGRATNPVLLAKTRAEVDAWKAALGTEEPLPVPQLNDPLVSLMAWHVASPGTQADLASAEQLLAAAGARRNVNYVEVQYLKLLSGWLDWQGSSVDLLAPALAAQQQAEQAAGLPSPRGHYWNRTLVDQADAMQDKLFDAMLTGSEKSRSRVEQAHQQLTGSRGMYGQANEIGRLVELAHGVRDEAWATIPHLMAWVDSEAWIDNAGIQTDGQSQSTPYWQTLSKLIKDAHDLSDAIDQLPPELLSAAAAAEPLERRVATVRVGLDALIGAFDHKCSTLLHDETFKDDERTIRQIAAVLELPLLPNNSVADRMALLSRLVDHHTKPYSHAEPGQNLDVQDGSDYVVWLTSQETTHGLSTLDRTFLPSGGGNAIAAEALTPLSQAAVLSERYDRLVTLEQQMRKALEQTRSLAISLAAEPNGETPFDCRRGLSLAERVVRSTAPLRMQRLWQGPDLDQEPVARLRDFDQHALHLWHGQRAVQRFWASEENPRAYFARLAEHQLNARRKYTEANPKPRPEIARATAFHAKLRDDIQQQEKVLAQWNPAVKAKPITVTGDSVKHAVAAVAPALPLPRGALSIYLADQGQMLTLRDGNTTVRRRAVDSTKTTMLEHVIPDARSLSVGSLFAHSLFRGHHRQQPFDVSDPGELVTVWRERIPKPPGITVRGDSSQKSQIMFVLDCSGSMDDAPFGGKPTRLAFAIDTLSRTIDLLDESHFIGLTLYGHRAPDNKRINPAAASDVEIVHTIARKNDEAERDDLKQKFEGRRARGATPLYLAIQEAINSFNRPIGGVKTVVVLTDGDNKVPGGGPNPSASDVVATWNKSSHKPNIHIVSIAERLTRASELRQITSNRGELHEKVTADQLRETIEAAVGLRTFRIEDRESGQMSDEIRLGAKWTEKTYQDWDLDTVRRDYRVHVGSATTDVTLEGGEHLDVIFNARRGRLEFKPYLPNRDQQVEVTGAPDIFAVSHVTRMLSGSQFFGVSIQNRDAFTPRPRHVWAELQPLGFGANAKTIYAYDADFRMGTPVPLFQFRVRNWPGAETARVKVWFSYQDLLPGEVKQRLPLDRDTVVDTSKFPGVRLTAKPKRLVNGDIELTLIETHGDDSSGRPLRIRSRRAAKKTKHETFAKVQRIEHVLILDRAQSVVLGLSQDAHFGAGWYETEAFEITLPNR